jgi:hypothetical protein
MRACKEWDFARRHGSLARATNVKTSDLKKKARGRKPDTATVLRELWFSITRTPWRTLVMLPAHEGGSALSLAYELVEVGSAVRRKPIELISAEGMDLTTTSGWLFDAISGGVRPLFLEADAGTTQPDRFERIVVLESIASNSMGIAVAQAADAVLLVVEQGVSNLANARATVAAIGRERFVGCAITSS